MGRYCYSNRLKADSLKKIDMSELKRDGCLKNRMLFNWTWTDNYSEEKNSIGIAVSVDEEDNFVVLLYNQTNDDGEKKKFNYKVKLSTTPCNYGGKRYWFICPLYKDNIACKRRVRILYKVGDYFGCRHCFNLTYASRNSEWGANLSESKIEKLESQIKREYYNGKMTRKFASLQNKIIRDNNKWYKLTWKLMKLVVK